MSKIKVLFLAAYPDANPLKLDEEIRAITQKIRASEYRNTLDLASAWAVRPDDLLQTFNEHKPHIVHFSGHGSPSGEIILVDESLVNGKRVSKPISPVTIKALFQALKDNIQVVLLNACYSRIQAEAIRDVIDCVIGMNSAISDQAAITFAASFYRALGFGRSLKEAFEQGKVSLLLEGIPEDDTPELLCRSGIDPAKVFLIGHPTDSGRVSTNTLPVEIPTYPYDGFGDSFREIVFPKRFVDSNAVLHIVFGDISDIQYMTPTIPINQSYLDC
jgi:CHAT domain-containing protein